MKFKYLSLTVVAVSFLTSSAFSQTHSIARNIAFSSDTEASPDTLKELRAKKLMLETNELIVRKNAIEDYVERNGHKLVNLAITHAALALIGALGTAYGSMTISVFDGESLKEKANKGSFLSEAQQKRLDMYGKNVLANGEKLALRWAPVGAIVALSSAAVYNRIELDQYARLSTMKANEIEAEYMKIISRIKELSVQLDEVVKR